MVHTIAPDPLLTCPLDESHRILKSRMQFHLVRCLKNHKLGVRVRCPWNPLHIIDKFAYENHYKTCDDMPQACASSYLTDGGGDVGSVPVNATNYVLPPPEEDWDAEPGPVGTYDPTKNAEGRPVLRIAVGLSKAKKKQWRQAERERFQRLEANGPLPVESRPPEDPEVPKSLRPPRSVAQVLSKDTSMTENLNKSSEESERKHSRKGKTEPTEPAEPPKLRVPHSPSPALMYRGNVANPRNGARRKSSVSSDDGSQTVDEMPNLCSSYGASYCDTASRRSSVSSQRSNLEIVRKTIEKNMRMSSLNSSLQYLSEAANAALLDEAAAVSDLPNLVAPIDAVDNESVREITERIAELTTQQRELDEKKTALRQQMSMIGDRVPNLVSSGASHASLDAMSNASMSVYNDPPPATPQMSLLGGITKCAANFPKLRNAARPPPGLGRGIMIAKDSFQNDLRPNQNIGNGLRTPQRPASRTETNPFLVTDVGNISQLTYTLSADNADDESSIYGYERAD